MSNAKKTAAVLLIAAGIGAGAWFAAGRRTTHQAVGEAPLHSLEAAKSTATDTGDEPGSHRTSPATAPSPDVQFLNALVRAWGGEPQTQKQ